MVEVQLLKHADVANEQGCDAIITISAKFAGDHLHHFLLKRRGKLIPIYVFFLITICGFLGEVS